MQVRLDVFLVVIHDSKMTAQTVINNLPLLIKLYCLQYFLVFGKAITLHMNSEIEAQTVSQNLPFLSVAIACNMFRPF
jgi:hypothetical protein